MVASGAYRVAQPPGRQYNLIHVMVAQAFYNWAAREINPLHPDLPRIMLRQLELSDKAHRVFN